jgi:hypothetical protein
MRFSKKVVAGAAGLAAAVAIAGIFVANSANADSNAAADTQTAAAVYPAKDSVTGYHIKDGTIYGADLGPGMVKWFTGGPYNNSVGSDTVRDGTLAEKDLNKSVADKLNSGRLTGLESDSPYPCATQLGDYPGNGANSDKKFVGDGGTTLQRAWVQCADGKTAIGGGYQRGDESPAAIKNLQIVTSSPTQIKDGKEVYEPIAGDAAGSLKPNAWLVEGFNNGDTELVVRPSVVCANIG